jgi:chemotaxis-related protein WspD
MAWHDAETPLVDARIDDCWNRIGTRGDRSCPRLEQYRRCLNCPVFEQAAARMLDRPILENESTTTAEAPQPDARGPVTDPPSATWSALVFRVVDEWFAFPSEVLQQVHALRPIHSLPHRREGTVLGLVNIRGRLTVAVSLRHLLNLEPPADRHPAQRNVYARMLVAAHGAEPIAFPVDQVEGVLRFAASARLPVPHTHAAASHASGVIVWRDTTIGLLDPERVFETLARSLR